MESIPTNPIACSSYRRRNLPRAVKRCVWGMTRGNCWYCGTYLNPFDNFVVEHIVPLCRGGSNDLENLAPACCYCNQSKGTSLVEEWRAKFADEQGLGYYGPPLFWFEREQGHPNDPPSTIPPTLIVARYSRVEWREVQIRGFSTYEDGD